MSKPDPILYLSDARGIYIPRDFAQETYRECISGVDDETLETLSDPEHEWYWEAWEDVCNNAIVTDPKSGTKYRVYQDGDCWLIPDGMSWDDEQGAFIWEESDND